jgi:peptidoglycan/xylan/chitin deacetylase (PgdA/CDA1 family)
MKQILLTCDTEIGETPGDLSDPFGILIEGNVKGQKVGYSLINQIASKYGAVITHFVDVYPALIYGKNRYRRLCEQILTDGHQLELHTHPASFFDPQRKWMYQYSLEDQKKILVEGKDRIFRWTGQEAFAHRAGGYGADDQTLVALVQTGFQMDCSYFANQPKCKVSPEKTNSCFQRSGIWEIPITVCQTLGAHSLSKLDWRYSLSSRDILIAISQAPDESVITLFLHSFNFLRLIYDPCKNHFEPVTLRQHLINEFEYLLATIQKNPECTFTSLNDITPSKASCSFLPQVNSIAHIQKRLQQEYFRRVKRKVLL